MCFWCRELLDEARLENGGVCVATINDRERKVLGYEKVPALIIHMRITTAKIVTRVLRL